MVFREETKSEGECIAGDAACEAYGGGRGRHSATWLTLAELLAPDYDEVFWDRRAEKQITLKEFLGEWFSKEVDSLE